MTNQNQNIPENVIQNIIDPFLKLKKADFFESVKLQDLIKQNLQNCLNVAQKTTSCSICT